MTYLNIDIQQVILVARKAGKAIMEIYQQDFEVEFKGDSSPLTEADKAANKIILSELQLLYPDIPYISEETKQTPFEVRKDWKFFWLIDPIDGTKEFIKRNGEFTVNIALVEDGCPVIGVVFAPALDLLYYAVKGHGSFLVDGTDVPRRLEEHTHYSAKQSINVVGSRSHLNEETMTFVEALKAEGKQANFVSAGSSLKLCYVAEGKADVYPRFGPTMEWDTGAAHAVALYAGRKVNNALTGSPLVYNKENLLNPYFIVE